ncbi:MAG: LptF/LptG family permease [Phycisphaerales bacterium]|nr:LptF/LptG family permease [Phycisphaerales bacterium]
MPTLTRYIARLYVVNILTMLLILFSFVVAVDVVINLDRFSDAAVNRMAEGGVTAERGTVHHALLTANLILNLWGPRLLQLFSYLNGFVLVAAMGFTCAQLVHHREFGAMLAGGISLFRMLRPFVLVAVVFGAVQVLNQEVLVPRVAHLLTRTVDEAGRRDARSFPVRLAPDDENRLFYASSFDDAARTLTGLRVWERDAQGRTVRVVSADEARWDGSGWALINGRIEPMAGGPGAPPDASPSGARPIDRLASTLDPARLKVRYLQGFGNNLSWQQIASLLGGGGLDDKARDRLERIGWGRLASLLSNLVTLVAALPFFVLRSPQPMLRPALKAAPIALAGLAAAAVAPVIVLPGLPVWLAVFVPCLLLAPLAIAIVTGMRT